MSEENPFIDIGQLNMRIDPINYRSMLEATRGKVAGFMANLMGIGLSKEEVSLKGYEYAIALQVDDARVGARVSADMMTLAAMMVEAALPKAARIYEQLNRINDVSRTRQRGTTNGA